ncbi:unnamed protein product [Nesidiocoris tenuis]|uniref:Uncharacterized protein n=1 Tax=Nesidiocoris tenuis TaxID=355587 RepID=A0A6H5G1N1_9HEMI|nr:unnamed protein product [Nesidiocoris tenuis]
MVEIIILQKRIKKIETTCLHDVLIILRVVKGKLTNPCQIIRVCKNQGEMMEY